MHLIRIDWSINDDRDIVDAYKQQQGVRGFFREKKMWSKQTNPRNENMMLGYYSINMNRVHSWYLWVIQKIKPL